MRVRYGVAAVFAAAIALVLVLRHEGYLHGRVTPGPLTFSGGDESLGVKPGQTAVFELYGRLRGEAVEIDAVRPRFASPRLEVLGPRRTPADCSDCTGRWPPRDAGAPLRHRAYAERAGRVAFGLRATSRGIYYLHEFMTLYSRGSKAFASTVRGDWCVTVGGGRECALGYTPPSGSTIVEWGGPSRYGVPVRAAVGGGGTTATFPLRAGTRTLAITLSNLTSTARTVSDLRGDLQLDAATVAQPEETETTIPPHGGRRFLLQVDIPACRTDLRNNTLTLDRLEANVDGRSVAVPLSVALAFRGVSAC